jgi:hypothetical protein
LRPPSGGRRQTAQTSCCRRARWVDERVGAVWEGGRGREGGNRGRRPH